MALLDVQHVKKIYKTRFKGNQVEALKDIHFTVEKGDYVAIMGESGSGKSTLLNILSLLEKYPYEISGGQKQRVAVARAIITKPEILLADEPTGALDSKSSAALLDVFDAINASGQTILMVTHSTAAASRAQRVLFIKDGILYNQIFKGDKSEHQMFQEISDTLTVMASEVN